MSRFLIQNLITFQLVELKSFLLVMTALVVAKIALYLMEPFTGKHMNKPKFSLHFNTINFHKILDFVLRKLKAIGYCTAFLLVFGFGIFLYRNFYLTIINAQQVSILERDTSAEVVNQELLQKVVEEYKNKSTIEPRNWSNYKSLFVAGNSVVNAPILNPDENPDDTSGITPGGF